MTCSTRTTLSVRRRQISQPDPLSRQTYCFKTEVGEMEVREMLEGREGLRRLGINMYCNCETLLLCKKLPVFEHIGNRRSRHNGG